MNASFSLRRFGVISPINSARWSVWVGGAVRDRRPVAEDSQRLVVTRHHDDVVTWFAAHRPLASQLREVRVWVVDELAVPEEILRVFVAHRVIAPLRVPVDRKGAGFTNG
jgi:hypothetical protein